MSLLSPIKLGLAKRLADGDYRRRFLRRWAQHEVAAQVRSLRERRRLRQVDLARRCDMKQSAVSRLEQADYAGWSFRTLLKLAEGLDARLRVVFEPIEDVIAEYERREAAAGAPELETVSAAGYVLPTLLRRTTPYAMSSTHTPLVGVDEVATTAGGIA